MCLRQMCGLVEFNVLWSLQSLLSWMRREKKPNTMHAIMLILTENKTMEWDSRIGFVALHFVSKENKTLVRVFNDENEMVENYDFPYSAEEMNLEKLKSDTVLFFFIFFFSSDGPIRLTMQVSVYNFRLPFYWLDNLIS